MKMPNILWLAWWVLGLFLLAGLVLRWWTGDQFFVARYTGYLMPWLLLLLLPGALWAGLINYRWLMTLLLFPTVIIVANYAPLFWSRPGTSDPAVREFRVLSYNTWSKNFDTVRIAGVVKAQKPDILFLQEVKPDIFESLKKHLQNLYDGHPVYFAYEPQLLLAVVSRYPADSSNVLKGKGRVQKVVLSSPSGPISVFNVHMLRRGGWSARYRKVASLLREDIILETGPVILAGDFNTTDQAETYKHISKVLKNAHWEAGYGFGFSFPSSVIKVFGLVSVPSLIRIDHIFFNNHFWSIQAGTIKDSGGSDHFPVMAVLGLK